MRRFTAMIALAATAGLGQHSERIDFTAHDRRHEDSRGPRSGSRASWYYNPEMTAAELVKRAAHSRRARRTHRHKRGKRARF